MLLGARNFCIGMRSRAVEGSRAVARELGLSGPRRAFPEAGVLAHDGGDGLFNAIALLPQARALAHARKVVAHLAAACLETGRALWLPALRVEGRAFFLWTYLDLRSVEALGVATLETHFGANHAPRFRNASLLVVDRATARVATDDARDDDVAAFAIPEKGARPETVLLDLAKLLRPDVLLLHMPFLDRDAPRRDQATAAPSLAAHVLAQLRWCPELLVPEHDARLATAAASCWGRGTALDAPPA